MPDQPPSGLTYTPALVFDWPSPLFRIMIHNECEKRRQVCSRVRCTPNACLPPCRFSDQITICIFHRIIWYLSIFQFHRSAGDLEGDLLHWCACQLDASCVRLAAADVHLEGAGLKDRPAFVVDEGHLPGRQREGHFSLAAGLEEYLPDTVERPLRHFHAGLDVLEVKLDGLLRSH